MLAWERTGESGERRTLGADGLSSSGLGVDSFVKPGPGSPIIFGAIGGFGAPGLSDITVE